MARTAQEYHARWQQAMQHLGPSEIVEDEELTNESCVISESAHSTPMGEGMLPFPDFGHAICYYRYVRVPDELEPRESILQDAILPLGLEILMRRWEHRRPKLSGDDLLTRRIAAEQVLDALLEEFVQQGYQPGMSEHLQEIVNVSLIDFELDEVYVFPGDLDVLLSSLDNPLVDYNAYETEEAEADAPAFDLKNPEHRAALKERIWMVGR